MFWASLLLFLFTPGLAAVWNLIGHDVAMLVCCLFIWYGSSLVSSDIGKHNHNSKWFFIIIWKSLCGTGTNFRKKWKHRLLFNRTSGPIFMFFLSAKPIKLTVFNNSGISYRLTIVLTCWFSFLKLWLKFIYKITCKVIKLKNKLMKEVCCK